MKDIFYDKENVFMLTEKEFKGACIAWSKKDNYYCERLGALLTPYFKFAETPKYFKNPDKVFFSTDKCFPNPIVLAKSGKYYEIVPNDCAVPLPPSVESSLVKAEDFLNGDEKKKITGGNKVLNGGDVV